jgi:putative oxidoreductase
MNHDKTVVMVARALMAAIFIVSGLRKLFSWSFTLGYFQKLGVPVAEVVLPLAIALEIGGGLLLLAGWRLRPVSLALAAFTLAAGFIGHAFWAVDAAQFTPQLNNFMKNVAMAGGFLLLYVLAGQTGRGEASRSAAITAG